MSIVPTRHMSARLRASLFGCLLLSLGLAPTAWAQQTSGAVSVTVVDPSGAAIPGALLSLTDLATSADHSDRPQVKLEWAKSVTEHWGYCGVLAYQDDAVIGHLSVAPAMYVPRLSAFATTPVSADALRSPLTNEFGGTNA